MPDFVVYPSQRPLAGIVSLPSDKSISHRAIMLAAIANGTSRIERFSYGGDNLSTAHALRAMGIAIDEQPNALIVHGRGLRGLRAPTADLDCGNSGTTMRLLAGLLAGQTFPWRMVGDASLMQRPMRRVVDPLAARGAHSSATIVGQDARAPLASSGREPNEPLLGALTYALPTASAQVKSALLLSGLYASGLTELSEPTISRDHTERMLAALGVPIETGDCVRLEPRKWSRELPAFELAVPGDLSAAAFLLAAGLLVPKSQFELRDVGVNPSRAGVLDWLSACGFFIQLADRTTQSGEPVATLHVEFGRGRASAIAGDMLVRAIDEVPAICAIAAGLEGDTTIADAQELRVKESDRIHTSAAVLRAFGLEVEEHTDGLTVRGQPDGQLKQCAIDSHGDHRIAMMAAVLALRAEGECRIRNVACVDTSFPRFAETLHAIGARIEIV